MVQVKLVFFTIHIFKCKKKLNVIVFPSLGLINQYNNDYFLNENKYFEENFREFKCLAFCSDSVSKLKNKSKDIVLYYK